MGSPDHSQSSDMTGFTDLVRRNMPPPLPPRLCGSMKPTCFCQPSSSKKYPPKQEVVENADSFDLFPHRLANPSSDFDTDSLGFVDIEELRKLEELISCDHVSLSTEVSISSDGKEDPSEHPELVFWRAVATQRASELDGIKEEIEKIVSLTMKNIAEKKELDSKHDELYSQLQRILESSDGEEDPGTPANEERQIT
ncbi:unnamed protein product [Haemonchus placei]|uniref:BMERB domain-containing protein n=1 Tax=Haemonchus placei TaxID=6290 RepID=A0A158QMZ2_HAEPC|nr:unnamed protein product [Haemonchus placei]